MFLFYDLVNIQKISVVFSPPKIGEKYVVVFKKHDKKAPGKKDKSTSKNTGSITSADVVKVMHVLESTAAKLAA